MKFFFVKKKLSLAFKILNLIPVCVCVRVCVPQPMARVLQDSPAVFPLVVPVSRATPAPTSVSPHGATRLFPTHSTLLSLDILSGKNFKRHLIHVH